MTMRCLIIDDEPMLAEMLKMKLETLFPEAAADMVHTASEGLEYLRIHKDTDLVFLDMQMPGMHGLELLKTIRLEGLKPEVIVVSGHRDFHFVQSAWRMHARAYITKPVDMDELESVLRGIRESGQNNTAPENEISYIDVPAAVGVLRIRRDEILYLKASGRRAELVKTGGEHEMLHISLGEAEKLLSGKPFIRAGRFVILNETKVRGFIHKDHTVILQHAGITEHVLLGRGAYSALLSYLKAR